MSRLQLTGLIRKQQPDLIITFLPEAGHPFLINTIKVGNNTGGGVPVDNENLIKSIEKVRDQLHKLIHKNGKLTDEEVLKKSRELDSLLQELYKLLKK
jgi:hypothetical protein